MLGDIHRELLRRDLKAILFLSKVLLFDQSDTKEAIMQNLTTYVKIDVMDNKSKTYYYYCQCSRQAFYLL